MTSYVLGPGHMAQQRPDSKTGLEQAGAGHWMGKHTGSSVSSEQTQYLQAEVVGITWSGLKR